MVTAGGRIVRTEYFADDELAEACARLDDLGRRPRPSAS
jgi:hypothetical protein